VETRTLGPSALAIPKLVLGAMFRDAARREAELLRLLDTALDAGVGAVDTAPLYEFGRSETLLGRWLRGRRERVLVLGKVGLRWDGDHGAVLFDAEIDGRRRAVRRDSRPEAIVRDVDESLRRLGTDRIDLIQIHHRDRGTPLADSLGALVRLEEAGKLRAIGVCNFDGPDLAEAERILGPGRLASVQSEYSLLERGAEREIIPHVAAHRVGFLAYSPLARGILGGRVLGAGLASDDGRGGHPLYQAANARRIHRTLAERVKPLAEARGVGLAAIALAWVMAQPGITAAIAGPQDERQLRDAIDAARIALSPGEQRDVGDAFASLPLDRRLGVPLPTRILRRLRAAWARRVG